METHSSPSHTPTDRALAIAAFAAVLLLAAVLRIYHITQQSIWFDEAFAWNIVIQDDMFPRISTDTHPPLYYLLLRGWMTLAGDSALSLRYLSALISLGTVALVVQVARHLLPVDRSGMWQSAPLLVGLVLALSDAEIFLAQETRNYALYTFFACLSMWLYLRWLRWGGRGIGLAWAAATAALVYTHYQGLFIPAVQGMYALLFLRDRQRLHAVGWLVISGMPVLPWFLFVTIPQARNAIDNSLPFAIPTNWETFLHLRDSYLGAVWSLLLVLALFGLVQLVRQGGRRGTGRAFIVGMWFLLPFAVLFFGNLFAALLTERKLLIVAPAIALMVGFGLARLDRLARLLVVVALIIYGISAVDYYRVKEPWDHIAQPALELGQPGDLYLAQVEVGQYPMKYYWQRNMPDGALFATFPFLGDPTMAPTTDFFTFYDGLLEGDLIPYNRQNRTGPVATSWVVFWSKDDTVLQRLEGAGYARTMTWTTDHLGNDIDLYRYDDLPAEPAAVFANGMVLQAVEVDPAALRVDLWWTADMPLDADYTTSVVLLDASGQVVAQLDGPPPTPTSQLAATGPVYDPKPLVIAGEVPLPQGVYTVAVRVYLLTPEGIEDVGLVDGAAFYDAGEVRR
ncbi:MAG: glycosyltransferase family 39 protein [Chloroflexota bacterium]